MEVKKYAKLGVKLKTLMFVSHSSIKHNNKSYDDEKKSLQKLNIQ